VQRARRSTTIVLGTLTAALGLAMVVSTLARGGGPTAVGVVIGVAFAFLGAARVYIAAAPRYHRRDR
jgi:uncharacterized membrane protein HdeD (DUF308 family)